MYTYLIFDADHTLIDFDEDERDAFRRTFSAFGAEIGEAEIQRSWELSYVVWAEHGLNDVHLPEVQSAFHRKYTEHLPYLFGRILAEIPINASAEELSARFLSELKVPSHRYKNGYEVYVRLSKKYKTCIATNGLSEMQRARLQEFLPYTHMLFISEELGAIKPNPRFFEEMLARLGAKAEECLFIGDSLSSDVAGALGVGLPCVWFNPKGGALPAEYQKAERISDLAELERRLAKNTP